MSDQLSNPDFWLTLNYINYLHVTKIAILSHSAMLSFHSTPDMPDRFSPLQKLRRAVEAEKQATTTRDAELWALRLKIRMDDRVTDMVVAVGRHTPAQENFLRGKPAQPTKLKR